MMENTENQNNANNPVQEEITVENIGKYRDVLEKKLEERKTPDCIKNALLYTVDYINDEINDIDYAGNIDAFVEYCKKLDNTGLTEEETRLREEELNTMQKLDELRRKTPYYLPINENFITTEEKKEALLKEILPYF